MRWRALAALIKGTQSPWQALAQRPKKWVGCWIASLRGFSKAGECGAKQFILAEGSATAVCEGPVHTGLCLRLSDGPLALGLAYAAPPAHPLPNASAAHSLAVNNAEAKKCSAR